MELACCSLTPEERTKKKDLPKVSAPGTDTAEDLESGGKLRILSKIHLYSNSRIVSKKSYTTSSLLQEQKDTLMGQQLEQERELAIL